MAVRPRISDDLCHEAAEVRQWLERSCRSCQCTDQVWTERRKHHLRTAVSVRVCCRESAAASPSRVRRDLDGAHNTAMAVELGWCRRVQNYAGGQDQWIF